MYQNKNCQNKDNSGLNPYACWLAGIEGVGSRCIKALLQHATGAEEVYTMSETDIVSCLSESMIKEGTAKKAAALIIKAQKRDVLEESMKLAAQNIRFTSQEDDDYPSRLREIPDSPYGLYYFSRLPAENNPCVAIVGARNCSGYGREQARIFAERLAENGISIISGMARGIDGIAGRAAVKAGGSSFAVLGCGVDVVYPRENADLYMILKDHGGIISENRPGTQPRSVLFPMRNRLISGLADAVLVIEARRRSGTVITVDAALEQGRDIFALPGRVSDNLSDGCNFLISQGAVIACSPDSIIEHFYGVSDKGTDLTRQKWLARNQRASKLSGLEAVLFDVLGDGTIMESEFLHARAEAITGHRISVEEFMGSMVSLQVKGFAVEIGMGHYKGI